MEEEKEHQKAVLPIQGADPTGNPASPATVVLPHSKRNWIVITGILVLMVIIAVAYLVFGILATPGEPIVGTWTVEPAGLQMQFDADGTATLRYPDTGDYATGRWEKVAENHYHLLSAKGTASPPLSYDPISDILRTDDYSMIFVRMGG